MSFSQEVKEELKKVIPEKAHCLRAEIAGLRYAGGRNVCPAAMEPLLRELSERLKLPELKPGDPELLQRTCCKKSFLRGVFLSAGLLSDPGKGYHLEIVCETRADSRELRDMMNYFDIEAKTVERKGNYVVYCKEGDQVADFLALIKAELSLLNLENVRVLKDVRNKINRRVNCETANLGKTVSASLSQTQAIERLKKNDRLDGLPFILREAAELRLQYPEATLTELGQMMDPPVGKSGVNHRLRKLKEIAEEELYED